MTCPKCGRAVVVPMPGSEPSQSTRAAPAPDPKATFGLVQQPAGTPPPVQKHLSALDELEADRPRRGRQRLRNDNDDQRDRDQHRGIDRERKRKGLIVALAVSGGISLVGLAVLLGVMLAGGMGSTASLQKVKDITRQNQELMAKLEKTEAEAREKRGKEEADAKAKEIKAKRDAEEQAARKLAEEKATATAKAEAAAPPKRDEEAAGLPEVTSIEKLLAGLTEAEKKYAADYLRTGKRQIPKIEVGYRSHERSLAGLRTGEYSYFAFLGGVKILQVVNKREFLAQGHGDAQGTLGAFWVEGVSTVDFTDGAFVDLYTIPLFVAGTKTYKSVLGSRTVKHFAFFNTEKVDRLVERYFAELRANKKALEKKLAEEWEKELAKKRAEEEAAEARREADLEKANRAAAPLLGEAKKLYENDATREKGKKALEEIASKYPGTKTATAARNLLAASMLLEAKKLLAGKDTLEKARKGLREVVRLFPDTATATEARRLLKIEAPKERHDKSAAPHLRAAWKLYDQGLLEKAREGLREMLKEYPTSKTTEDARKLLEKIDHELSLKKPDK
jgi:TolA-binding protein